MNLPTGATEARARPGYGRWRAASLALVYVLFAAHVVHWKLRGETLAPLELNEVMYTVEVGVITAGFLFMAATAVGTLVVSEIQPSGVVFLHGGARLRRRVGQR